MFTYKRTQFAILLEFFCRKKEFNQGSILQSCEHHILIKRYSKKFNDKDKLIKQFCEKFCPLILHTNVKQNEISIFAYNLAEL